LSRRSALRAAREGSPAKRRAIGRCSTGEELLEMVATEAPESLHRPLPPFTEVVRKAGLEVEEGWVGFPGTDWPAFGIVPSGSAQETWGYEPPRRVQ
jgi:hypothetical protein